MATKDSLLFTKNKNQSFVSSSIKDGVQYTNLNLNHNHPGVDKTSFIQSESKSSSRKEIDSTTFHQEKLQSAKSSSKAALSSNILESLSFNDESKEANKKHWRSPGHSNLNSSTLSLHIAAYENAIEAASGDPDSSSGNSKIIKKWKNELSGPTKGFRSPYEFPRNRKDLPTDPEVMQFKASQRLLNPDTSNNHRQQKNPRDYSNSSSTTSSCSDGVIDTLSVDSMLTTVPCTTITEIQRPFSSPTNDKNYNRFKHEMNGWSPDIYGNAREFAAGDHNNNHHHQYYSNNSKRLPTTSTPRKSAPTPMIPKANGSSVYMMNYEQKFPAKNPRPKVMQKVEPPSGFAVPVKASASDSDGPSRIFSSPLPVYHLKANPMHRGTFYKTTFQSIEKLDSNEIQRGIWTTPNSSPRMSVLHLSCNSGAVTAVNLATGQAIQKTLSSTSISAGSEISEMPPPSLAEESTRMMKLRKKWTSQDISLSSSQSNYSNRYDEAWNEVNKEITNLQKMFDENDYSNNSYENVYRTDEEREYQRQLLHDYGPYMTTTRTSSSKTEEEFDDYDYEEEESEMQFMQASEPSEFEKNVKFRRDFEKIFKGRYEPNGEIDQWLKMITDETQYPQYHQKQRYKQRQQHYDDYESDGDTLVDEEESFDEIDDVGVGSVEDEEQVLRILSTCENVLRELNDVTAAAPRPRKPSTAPRSRKSSKFGLKRKLSSIKERDDETTPRAASSTIGCEESFDIIRY